MSIRATVIALCLAWTTTAWGEYRLPASNKAVLIDVKDTAGPEVVSQLRQILEKRGWRVEVVAGTVQNLRTKIKDVGFLWISTHGIDTTLEAGPSKGSTVYSLLADEVKLETGCPFGEVVCRLYTEDTAAGRLFGSTFFEGRQAKYFGITGAFIAHYWTFARDAIVVIDGCDVLKPRAPGSEIVQGLRTQPVAVVYGWDASVYKGHTRRVIPLMVDRWLGGNIVNPEKKPQRPFDLASVYGWLDRWGLTRDTETPKGIAVLRAMPLRAGVRSLMAPSIESLSVDEDKELLILSGQFGVRDGQDRRSEVLVWQERDERVSRLGPQVKSWSDEEIIAEIPRIGPNSAGYIVVSVNGIRSNAVPLTLLTGTAFQKITITTWPGLFEEVSCPTVRVRGDFHTWRKEPGGSLFVGDRGMSGPATGEGRVVIQNPVRDSVCAVKGYGRYQSNDETQELRSPPDPTLYWREYSQPADYKNGWFAFLTEMFPVSRQMTVTWNMQHTLPLMTRRGKATHQTLFFIPPAMLELQRVKIDLGPQLELPPWSRRLTNQFGFPTDMRLEFRSDFPPSDEDEG